MPHNNDYFLCDGVISVIKLITGKYNTISLFAKEMPVISNI